MNPANPNKDEVESARRPCKGKHGPRFTPDEIRVWRECKSDSFWQRSFPISTALGIATYYGVNAGYLKKNARFGAAPKVALAVIVGYFVGKFSYRRKCEEKFMQLPNSKVGDMLKDRRKFFQESFYWGYGPGMCLAPWKKNKECKDHRTDSSRTPDPTSSVQSQESNSPAKEETQPV